jgi:hypothetical protein
MTGGSLAKLARRVRRLPAFGRLGPEAVAEERDEIAAELQRLARTAPRPVAPAPDAACTVPSRSAPPRPPVVHLAQERLRRLLAEAARRPARRKRAGAGQLELPLA